MFSDQRGHQQLKDQALAASIQLSVIAMISKALYIYGHKNIRGSPCNM